MVFFFFTAPTAQNSPVLNFRFIFFFIQPSRLGSLPLTPPPFDPQLFCYIHVKLLVVKGRWRINIFFEPLQYAKKNCTEKKKKGTFRKVFRSNDISYLNYCVHKLVCTYLIKKVNITNFTNSLPTNWNLQKKKKNRKTFSHKWEVLQQYLKKTYRLEFGNRNKFNLFWIKLWTHLLRLERLFLTCEN